MKTRTASIESAVTVRDTLRVRACAGILLATLCLPMVALATTPQHAGTDAKSRPGQAASPAAAENRGVTKQSPRVAVEAGKQQPREARRERANEANRQQAGPATREQAAPATRQQAASATREQASPETKGPAHQADRFVVVTGYAAPLFMREPRRPPATAKLRSPTSADKRSCSPLPHSS